MRVGFWLLAITFGIAWQESCLAAPPQAAQSGLRLNQIQVLGTHNSYHLRPPAGILKAAIAVPRMPKTGITRASRSTSNLTTACATSSSI